MTDYITEMMKTAGVELEKTYKKYLFGWIFEINCQFPDFTQALAQLTTELMNAGELDKEKVKEILEK